MPPRRLVDNSLQIEDLPRVEAAVLAAESAVGRSRRVVELGRSEIDDEMERAVAAVLRDHLRGQSHRFESYKLTTLRLLVGVRGIGVGG